MISANLAAKITSIQNATSAKASRRLGTVLIFLLLLPAIVACSNTTTSTPLPIQSTDPIKLLYQEAKLEGGLAIMSFDDTYAKLAAGPFAERFPGITIKAQKANTPEMTARIIAQEKSGVYATDLIQGSAGSVLALADRGLIAGPKDIDWTSLGYPSGLLQAEGHLPVQWDFVYVHAYNTDLIDPLTLPQTLDDFANLQWKGKTVASPFLYPSGMGFAALERGESSTIKIANRIADAGLVLSNSAESLLTSGEAHLMVHVSINRIIKEKRKGAPVEYFFTPVSGAARIGLAMVKNAPHPSTAQLFNYWLSTSDGKNALFAASAQALVSDPNGNNEIMESVRQSGTKLVLESDENWRERSRLTGAIRSAVLGQ